MKQNSTLKSTKGYLQIDVAFAILIFFLLFLTIHSSIQSKKESNRNLIISNELEMLARDTCMIITSQPGIPNTWEHNNISETQLFGLKSTNGNELDTTKISRFNSTNYFFIRNTFDENIYISIKIKGVNSQTNYLDFGINTKNTNIRSGTYNCYSLYNSEPVQLIVEAWK